MNMSKKVFSGISLVSALVLSACGSDSSSSPNTQHEASIDSSSATGIDNPEQTPPPANGDNTQTNPPAELSSSSEAEAQPPLSSFEEATEQSSASSDNSKIQFTEVSEEEILKDRAFVALSTETDFVDLKTVYENLAPNEKVAFVIRHARRESSTGIESQLTEQGVEQAKRLGSFLVSDEAFSYGHTGFVRTLSTAQYIAEGRNEVFPEPVLVPELVASTFVADTAKFNALKSENSIGDEALMYSRWAFDGDFTEAFNDLEKTSIQIITQAILPRMSTQNRVNIFISHDMFLGPLVAYCTNKKLTKLRKHAKTTEGCTDCRWIYFLEGVAIIVKENGDRRYIPVSGIEWAS